MPSLSPTNGYLIHFKRGYLYHERVPSFDVVSHGFQSMEDALSPHIRTYDAPVCQHGWHRHFRHDPHSRDRRHRHQYHFHLTGNLDPPRRLILPTEHRHRQIPFGRHHLPHHSRNHYKQHHSVFGRRRKRKAPVVPLPPQLPRKHLRRRLGG